MKQLFRNSTHTQSRSHDCLIAEIKGKKIKVIIEHIRGGNVKGKTEFYFDIPILVSGKVGTLVEVEL